MNYNTTPKEVYTFLNSNDELQNIYKRIEDYEISINSIAFHNIEHIKNVSAIAEKILTDLNVDEDTIYNCKIACLLHDVGSLQGKEEHAQRSYEFASNLFNEKNWIFKDSDIVLDAIKNHSAGFDNPNIITLSIILADKLDVKKTRISEAGKERIGNRQFQHVEDITINIDNNNLTINFITDGNLDVNELNEYYFTTKIFKAIYAFSEKMNLIPFILMDGKEWKL